MNVLLIMPPLTETGCRGLSPRFVPLLTLYVAAHLIKTGFRVKLFDAFLENASFQDIAQEVTGYQPDIISIAMADIIREVPFETSLSLITYLKNLTPKTTIIAFGAKEINFLFQYLENNNNLDYYFVGDPEETIVELLNLLNESKTPEILTITGLLYKKNGKIAFTGRRILDDLDRLEFPAWELIDFHRYYKPPHRYANTNFFPVIASRGCLWGKCLFCQDNMCAAKDFPYRVHSPQRVVKEIVYNCQKYGCKEIQFYDALFCTHEEWLLSLESELRKHQLSIRWSCLARIDMVNPKVLSIMRRMGCWNILFGVESGCEHLLKMMNKGISVKQIENAVRWCKNEGIEVTGSFLLGLPGERPEDIFKTVRFARKIGIDYVQFFIAKWAREHDEFQEMGHLMRDHDFQKYDFCGKVFIPQAYQNITHLKRVQRKAYLKFYMHPQTIGRHLKKVLSKEGMFRLYGATKVLSDILFNRN